MTAARGRSPASGVDHDATADRDLRVMHVVARLGLGGSERVVQTLAQRLVPLGVANAVAPVAADNDRALGQRVREELAASGVVVLGGSDRRSAKVAMIGAAQQMAGLVRAFRPDVVHLHTEIPEFTWAAATVFSPALRRLPLVRTVHSSRLWGGWAGFGRLAERRLSGATVVAVSNAAAGGFRHWRNSAQLPQRPVRVIYNGVECQQTDRVRAGRRGNAMPHLCFAGRFAHEKGADLLLDALEALDGDDVPFAVSIRGTGGDEPMIRRRSAQLRRHIDVGPPIANLRDQLASFDAIVMPSRFEGLPLLAVETICAGVALIASDAPGIDEAVPPSYPGRFRSGDPRALAERIAAFVTEPGPWRQVAESASDWARERFSPEQMVAEYLDVYRGMVSGRTGAGGQVRDRVSEGP